MFVEIPHKASSSPRAQSVFSSQTHVFGMQILLFLSLQINSSQPKVVELDVMISDDPLKQSPSD